jgi:endonuclease YncB( thermonuclease family)
MAGLCFSRLVLALALALWGAVLPQVARAEEEAAVPVSEGAADVEEEEDETKKLLKQLTISLVEDVVDEQTIAIRNAAKAGSPRMLLRLGNTAIPEKGSSLSEAEHKERLQASKDYFSKLVAKQMIHYKVAAEQYQPAPAEDGHEVFLADVWLVGGRHINSLLKKEGHLIHAEQYKEELARDILSAEADESKKQAYKDLEEALKESEAAKAKERAEKVAAQKAAEKAEAEKGEPVGLAGYAGLMVFLAILIGALTNFGRAPEKKKVNLNRKRGFVGRLFAKLKGN